MVPALRSPICAPRAVAPRYAPRCVPPAALHTLQPFPRCTSLAVPPRAAHPTPCSPHRAPELRFLRCHPYMKLLALSPSHCIPRVVLCAPSAALPALRFPLPALRTARCTPLAAAIAAALSRYFLVLVVGVACFGCLTIADRRLAGACVIPWEASLVLVPT